jgi:hypothetical protein
MMPARRLSFVYLQSETQTQLAMFDGDRSCIYVAALANITYTFQDYRGRWQMISYAEGQKMAGNNTKPEAYK